MVLDETGSPAGWSRARLDPQVITQAMRQRELDWPQPVLRVSVASTFQEAAELAADGAAEGTVVVAEEQTAGRGRLGRAWSSPQGGGLWLTIIVDLVPAQRSLLPFVAGLAVRNVVDRLLPGSTRALLKWPNDVVVDDGEHLRKIAGVLVEVREQRCLVGIGLNVSLTRQELPPGVAATSLRLSAGFDMARSELLVDLLQAFRDGLDHLRSDPHGLLMAYRSVSATLDREVEVTLPGGRRLRGRAVDLDPSGGLIVEDSDGNRELVTAGDVIHATI